MASDLTTLRRNTALKRGALFGGIGLVVALILSSLYFVFLHRAYAPLYTSLKPADAAAAVAELDKAKIAYKLQDGGATILVQKDQVDATRVKMSTTDLAQRGLVGFEMFSKSDMGLTEFAQRINYQRALQGELTRTILGLSNVESARVHLSLPDQSAFRADQIPPKASVELTTKDGMELSPAMVTGVQNLIAASVPSLQPSSVVVLNADGAIVSGARTTQSDTPDDQQLGAIETFYAARVRRALGALMPGLPFEVHASAEIGSTPLKSLDSWSPQTRTFPLKIDVRLPTDISNQTKARVQTAILPALSPALQGDSVSEEALSPPVVLSQSPIASLASTAPPTQPEPSSKSTPSRGLVFALPKTTPIERALVLAALLGLPCLALFALLLRRLIAGPGRLSAAQRAQMALQFKSLMGEEKENAA